RWGVGRGGGGGGGEGGDSPGFGEGVGGVGGEGWGGAAFEPRRDAKEVPHRILVDVDVNAVPQLTPDAQLGEPVPRSLGRLGRTRRGDVQLSAVACPEGKRLTSTGSEIEGECRSVLRREVDTFAQALGCPLV